jgi:hypothetical protein
VKPIYKKPKGDKMKKILLLVMVTIFSISTLQAQTMVTISPGIVARCEIRDYPLVNWIYDIKKEESTQDLKVTFKTAIGSCKDNIPYLQEFTSDDSTVSFFKEGLTLPWSYLPEISVERASLKSLKVSVSVDKLKLFKKKNHRHLAFNFHSGSFTEEEKLVKEEMNRQGLKGDAMGLYEYMRSLYFPWKMELSLNIQKDLTELSFMK